jgi:type VI secretion system secreted protein Hcp
MSMPESMIPCTEPTGKRKVSRSLGVIVVAAVVAISGFALSSTSMPHRAAAATVRPHAIDAFAVFSMNATSIPGEGPTGGPGSIEVSSWSFGVTHSVTVGSATGGAGAGRAKFSEFTITKRIDAASPSFFRSCTAGAHIKEVQLFVTPGTGSSSADYLTITLNNVFVSSINWSGPGDEAPSESISLTYQTVQIKYTQQTSSLS